MSSLSVLSGLSHWCEGMRPPEQAFWLYEVNGELQMHCRTTGAQWAVEQGWKGLVMLTAGWHVMAGDAQVIAIRDAGLARLQYFLDKGWPTAYQQVAACPGLAEPTFSANGKKQLQRWYLGRAMRGDADYVSFACTLRSLESYRVVTFLHDEANSHLKLHELAARYGVSVSHFRRLCRQAMGATVKTELRAWRAARALLAITEGGTSLTDLALSLGYASSSHFSKEIKELVGVVPSRLNDITRLPGL